MAKDPAFLFYPGDYLRDTQCLTESVQVAYDRIMCEHMRNICISQPQLNFFTKRLNEDQKQELMMVLESNEEGFFIPWVHESIIKRKAYSESRSKNRRKSYDNHMKTYEHHMENENANENVIINDKVDGVKGKKEKKISTYVKDNPPSLEDVRVYCVERSNGIDPQSFIDKNTTIGWLDKNKIPYKDWKAVIRTWENFRKVTNNIESNPILTKRPIQIVVIEKIAAGLDNHSIMQELVGVYSEHAINEALMRAYGEMK